MGAAGAPGIPCAQLTPWAPVGEGAPRWGTPLSAAALLTAAPMSWADGPTPAFMSGKEGAQHAHRTGGHDSASCWLHQGCTKHSCMAAAMAITFSPPEGVPVSCPEGAAAAFRAMGPPTSPPMTASASPQPADVAASQGVSSTVRGHSQAGRPAKGRYESGGAAAGSRAPVSEDQHSSTRGQRAACAASRPACHHLLSRLLAVPGCSDHARWL